MYKTILVMMTLLAVVGCQKQEQAQVSQGNQIPQERKEMAHKLILKSLQDLEKKDLKSAVSSLEGSIQIDPTESEAYLLLGQILLKVGENDRAVEFLDGASKNFPNNGGFFYMLSIANKMAGKKLPAVLAARRSAEIFQAEKDKDSFLKAAMLLQELINIPDETFAASQKEEAAKPATAN